MSPCLNRCLLAAVLGVTSMAAHAQWGVRWTCVHYEQHSKRVGGLNMLLGLDHDPSNRTNIGVDALVQWNVVFDDDDGLSGRGRSSDGYDIDYALTRRSYGAQFRSSYFLNGNSGAGLYLGPYLGFRSFSRRVVPEDHYDYNTFERITFPTAAATTMVFPVGMRFGVRTPLEGLFMDLHVAVGHQFGYDTEDWSSPVTYMEERDALRGFTIQLAYVVGVGW